MIVNLNNSQSGQASGCSFKSKVIFNDAAKRICSGNQKAIGEFISAFEKSTEKVAGKVEIMPNPFTNNGKLVAKFTDANGDEFINIKDNLDVYDFQKSERYDDKVPYKHSVLSVVARISDAMADQGRGRGQNNPFSVLFDNLVESISYQAK